VKTTPVQLKLKQFFFCYLLPFIIEILKIITASSSNKSYRQKLQTENKIIMLEKKHQPLGLHEEVDNVEEDEKENEQEESQSEAPKGREKEEAEWSQSDFYAKHNNKKKREWDMKDINREINNGKTLLIYKNGVYDLTKWKDFHPGGNLTLEHFTGKDATDVVEVYHPRKVLSERLPTFFVGPLRKGIKTNSNTPISFAFRELAKQLEEEGLYQTDLSFYLFELLRGFSIFLFAIFLLLKGPQNLWNCSISAFFLAMGWHQLVFIAHDSGHNSVFHFLPVDHFIGMAIGNFLSGVSIGWWKDSHNVHHVVTNHPEHDPDIQHLPFFAPSTRYFYSLYSTYYNRTMEFGSFAKSMVGMQNWLSYPILMFGRFNLYVHTIRHLVFHPRVRNRKWEVFGVLFFWVWFSLLLSRIPTWGSRMWFVFLSHALAAFLHVQITFSHYCMSTEETTEKEEFVKHQLRTTMDVDCPWWMDWLHGGLQFQATHHLFPRIPRHRLRSVRERVLQFCNQHGLVYHCYSFVKGNVMLLNHLAVVAQQLNHDDKKKANFTNQIINTPLPRVESS